VAGYLVARFTPGDIRLAHNDRAGFILAVIGVVYAVLLAFVAIGTWERFNQAELEVTKNRKPSRRSIATRNRFRMQHLCARCFEPTFAP